VRLGVEVRRIDRADGPGWRLDTSDGPLEAERVVVATGYNHTPSLQEWPGRDGFTGDLVHASRYRNAEPYRGRDVLVVGSGNTGAEIAVDLVEGGAARVRLAVRTPPNIVLREVKLVRAPASRQQAGGAGVRNWGLPNQVAGVTLRRLPPHVVDRIVRTTQRLSVPNLEPHGLPRPERGVYTRIVEDDVIPIIDVGLIDAVKGGGVEIVGALLGFDGDDVVLAGHERIQPEAVIVATGYRRGLERLVGGLGLIDERGKPVVHGNVTHPDAPGLYFTGYTNPISGMFREIGIDARRIAAAVAERQSARKRAAA